MNMQLLISECGWDLGGGGTTNSGWDFPCKEQSYTQLGLSTRSYVNMCKSLTSQFR
jgi:hypothetical protein